MNTCKTCKHWQIPDDTDDVYGPKMCQPVDPDTYQPMDRGFEIRICKQLTQTLFEAPIEANGFGITDGSNYFACLATGEAFGCVRHEP